MSPRQSYPVRRCGSCQKAFVADNPYVRRSLCHRCERDALDAMLTGTDRFDDVVREILPRLRNISDIAVEEKRESVAVATGGLGLLITMAERALQCQALLKKTLHAAGGSVLFPRHGLDPDRFEIEHKTEKGRVHLTLRHRRDPCPKTPPKRSAGTKSSG